MWVFVFCCAILAGDAVKFTPKNCDGDYNYALDSTHHTFISTARDYSRCRLATDKILPWDVEYTISLRIQNQAYSTPGIFFNEKDDSNYDFIFFRTYNSECVVPGAISDNSITFYNQYDTYCSGNVIDESAWTDIIINVTSTAYSVSVNQWPALAFPTAQSLKPSLGLIHGIGYESSCGHNCVMNFNELSILPHTDKTVVSHAYGQMAALQNPAVEPSQIAVFRIHIDNSGHQAGTFCVVTIYYQSYVMANGVLSIQGNTAHSEGAFEAYSTNDAYLDVLYNSFYTDGSPDSFSIQYEVVQCGLEEAIADMSFLCTDGNYIDLYDDYHRSMAYVTDILHTDVGLAMGWYRFSSCAGDTIPTTSPGKESVCGTLYPVWIKDDVHGIACQYRHPDECSVQWKIPIQQCDNFTLYYLTPTPPESGYCAGYGTRCDSTLDQVSVDGSGCGPCVDGEVPKMTENPTIGDWEAVADGYVLPCNVHGPVNSQVEVVYQVQWLVDYGTHRDVLQNGANFVPDTKHTLHSSLLRHEYLQHSIICQVRAKYNAMDMYAGNWFDSDPFFIGIKVTSAPSVLSKVVETISIRLTAPIAAPGGSDCSISLVFATTTQGLLEQTWCDEAQYLPPELVHHSPCVHEIDCATWDNEVRHNLHIKNTIEKLPKAFQQYNHTLYVITKSDNNQLWNNVITEMQVMMDYESNGDAYRESKCHSYNDPHLLTFRAIYYDVHQPGEYILYKSIPSANPDMQVIVTAEYQKCYPTSQSHIHCNVAVGVRVKDKAIVIDARESPPHRYIGTSYGENGFRVTASLSLTKYTVYLPRGEKVTVKLYGSLLNVDIHSLRENQKPGKGSGGLCGNVQRGDRKSDGLIRPDNGAPYKDENGNAVGDTVQRWETLHDFANLWKASTDDQIINKECLSVKSSTAQGNKYSCQLRNVNEIIAFSANHPDFHAKTSEIERCIIKPVIHIKDTRTGNVNTNCGKSRKKRQIVKPESRKNIRNKRSTDVVWTNDTAYAYCTEQIVDSSTGQACGHLIPDGVTDSVDMCVADILLTNTTEWTSGTVDSLRESCVHELYSRLDLWDFDDNVTSADNNETTIIPPTYIIANLCPNDCSGNGVCVDGECQCETGFIGTDCSLSVETPPMLVEILSGNICAHGEDCGQLFIVGVDYVNSDDLTCHFTIEQQYSSTIDNSPSITDTPGTLISYDVISCIWPTFNSKSAGYTKLSVAISNDGVHTSAEMTGFAVLHSPCFSCDGSGDAVNCHLGDGWCMIDNVCTASGDISTNNECLYCNPDVNTNSWTSSTGCGENGSERPCLTCTDSDSDTDCSLKPDWCIIDNVCRASGAKSTSDKCLYCNPDVKTNSWTSSTECGSLGSDNMQPCLNCVSGHSAGNCTLEAGWCMIDSVCITAYNTSTNDLCLYCDPIVDSHDWTLSSVCEAQDSSVNLHILPSLIGAIIIGSLAIVALAVGIALIVCSKWWKWKKVDETNKRYKTGSRFNVQEAPSETVQHAAL